MRGPNMTKDVLITISGIQTIDGEVNDPIVENMLSRKCLMFNTSFIIFNNSTKIKIGRAHV